MQEELILHKQLQINWKLNILGSNIQRGQSVSVCIVWKPMASIHTKQYESSQKPIKTSLYVKDVKTKKKAKLGSVKSLRDTEKGIS